jgi:Integrase zinc binding domain
MVQSDALSRRPDHGTDERMEEDDKVVLPDNLFINLLDTELQERILNGKELDLDVKSAIETLMEEGPTSLKNNLQDWKIEEIDGRKTIFFKGKNYIPKDLELRRDIVKMYHDHETAGHPGELETYNGSRQNFWWPGLRTFVKNYVQECGTCQQFKINRSPSNPAYVAIEGANNTRPFAKCSMDLITDLPPVEGFDAILVVVDRGLSKGVILCPCAKTIMWEGTATLLRDNLFKRFGRDHLRQRPEVCCSNIPRTTETIEHQVEPHHSIPSTVRRSYRKGKPRNRSVFVHILHVSPRRLATFT